MKHLITAAGVLSALTIFAASDLKVGITNGFLPQSNSEFVMYDKFAKHLETKGITPFQIEIRNLMPNCPESRISGEIRKAQVLFLQPLDESVNKLDPAKRASAERLGKELAAFVSDGGGLVVFPSPTRYPNHDDEEFWNIAFRPLGMQILHEGVIDIKTRKKSVFVAGLPIYGEDVFFTKNIGKHPVTEDVSGLWLPVLSYSGYPGVPLMKYSPEWNIIVRTEKGAKSWQRSLSANVPSMESVIAAPGSENGEIPLIAVRELGKGRIVCIPVSRLHTGLNFGKDVWSQTVETKGVGSVPSDLLKLEENAIRWCGESAHAAGVEGTYFPSSSHSAVRFPKSVSFDPPFGEVPKKQYRGIIGLHSSYSDGKSSVAEYVSAARKKGLAFIVFTDPLEKLTEKTFEKLKADCKAACKDDFYAGFGVEFTDGSGLRRMVLGEKVVWPGGKPFDNHGKGAFQLWDGKTIRHFGRYSEINGFAPCAIIDAGGLAGNSVRPENLHWFWNAVPRAYEGTKLIADNEKNAIFMLHDLRMINILPYTRIRSAEEVSSAADTASMMSSDFGRIKKILNTNSRVDDYALVYGKGLVFKRFCGVNVQEDPRPLHTAGCGRIRLRADVSSPAGIREVRIMDSEDGLLKRFDAKGAKNFSVETELVHDKQRNIWCEAVDNAGNRAVSDSLFSYDYKQGLFRCGDNLNILGPLGFCWHPDRQQRLPYLKPFRNTGNEGVSGIDCAVPICGATPRLIPVSRLVLKNGKDVFATAPGTLPAMRMDVRLANGEVQVVDSTADEISEGFDTETRPTPSLCSPPKILGKLPFVIHRQTMYAFRDRVDFHIAWDKQRPMESIQNYDGSILLYKGELEFTEDAEFSGEPLGFQLGKFCFEPRAFNGKIDLAFLRAGKPAVIYKAGKKYTDAGTLANGEWFSVVTDFPCGYLAVFPLSGERWNWSAQLPYGMIEFGVGTPGKRYRKGEKLEYAFATAVITDRERAGKRVALLAKLIAGDFPFEMQAGKHLPGPVVFAVKAQNGEAMFSVGPKSGLGIDLPVAVDGLEDNGCAAVYSSERPRCRFIGADRKTKKFYFQEPMERKNSIWAGNVFLADNPALKLTLVADGLAAGEKPFLEIHNPTAAPIESEIHSPDHAPRFGKQRFRVSVPAGSSIRRILE